MLPSRKSWSLTILFYCDFAKSWSQRQKVGVKYSKFGVNENSETASYCLQGITVVINRRIADKTLTKVSDRKTS